MGCFNSITKDIIFYGEKWKQIDEKFSPFLTKELQPYFTIFKLCASIGIMYDEQSDFNENDQYSITIPRTVLMNNLSELDYLFQTAIISSKHASLNVDERLDLAFNDANEIEFDKILFLKKFANWGVDKWLSIISTTATNLPIDRIYRINQYIESVKNGIIN